MLISLAVDFRHADVATRERFHLSEERLTQLYRTARNDVVREAALITTCNRTELYAWVDGEEEASVQRAVHRLALRWMRSRTDGEELLRAATQRSGHDAARHVVRIAAGLESQVLGDGQILGQLKAAYLRASRGHVTGPVLHRLFETALRAGKRVATETALTAGRQSVGAEAAITAAQRFGNLANARCVVVGAGKTGARAAKQLVRLGARDLVIVNRTLPRAEELAGFVHGRAALLEAAHVEVAMADVVIVATGSEVPVLLAGPLQAARAACAATGYPLLLMDLSVPRNIDPRVAAVAGVTLLDLDTLQASVQHAEELRRDAVPAAEAICAAEVDAFLAWVATMPAREAIRPLREALQDVAKREVAYVFKNDEVAERAASRIVAKLLAGPMAALRRAAQRGESLDAQAMLLLEMFTAEPTASSYPVPGTPTPRSTPVVPPSAVPAPTMPTSAASAGRSTPVPSSRPAPPARSLSPEQTA